jgi:uncharacterized membrane protein
MLTPLRTRGFALLWSGMAVSLLGDGIYFVAVAWEAYRLSDAPTALSLVGVAWTLPTVVFLLVGGAVSDRRERRGVMLCSALAQAGAIGAIGGLGLLGALGLPGLLALVALYGAAQAFFAPAFEAIVPTLVSRDQLPAASALDHFVRPLSLQLAGPAVGGAIIAASSPGVAFVVDAATFLAVAGTLLAMPREAVRPAPRDAVRPARRDSGRSRHEIAEAVRFVRANPWLWGTLAAAGLSLLAFYGPYQVLLPFLVKHELHAGGGALGAIRAAGGLGALAGAFAVGQAGLPRRFVTAMLAGWALQSLAIAGYALASSEWAFATISLAAGALGAVGNVVWGTLMKTLVPNEMLGRVSSLDWLLSIGLLPVSFAVTGPLVVALGARVTLIAAGLAAAVATLAFLAVPGLREPERSSTSPDGLETAPCATGPLREVPEGAAIPSES